MPGLLNIRVHYNYAFLFTELAWGRFGLVVATSICLFVFYHVFFYHVCPNLSTANYSQTVEVFVFHNKMNFDRGIRKFPNLKIHQNLRINPNFTIILKKKTLFYTPNLFGHLIINFSKKYKLNIYKARLVALFISDSLVKTYCLGSKKKRKIYPWHLTGWGRWTMNMSAPYLLRFGSEGGLKIISKRRS